VRIPLSKPTLSTALAIEWDHLISVQQATTQHLVPLTSLVCRALDIITDDQNHSTLTPAPIRASIVTTVLRYLDTDSLLCWAPPGGEHDTQNDDGESLRDVQRRTAEEVVGYLGMHVWPGVKLEPVLDGEGIVPRRQADGVREVVQGWVAGLDAWELAGLERAVLAGKSFIAAVRLLVEWSEGSAGVVSPEGEVEDAADGDGRRTMFGIEEAARSTSLEVAWQTGRWGEVEDTHDVEKEDLRRQFGSVVLLVSGTGRRRR
jgi:ATP synthase mitochondrial F1 complex assembly factor 2